MENDSREYIHQLIEDIQAQLARLKQVLAEEMSYDELAEHKMRAADEGQTIETSKGTVIEGVFDGQNMVGPDGKIYTVPANYASKSKLVEGDLMKLTIKKDGTFLYKQIGPVQRARVLAELVRDEQAGLWRAITEENHSYRLLTASVTYFKGEAGDTVVMLVPEDGGSKWAAVENIVPAGEEWDESMQAELAAGYTDQLEDGDDAFFGEDFEGELETGSIHELEAGYTAELPGMRGQLPAPEGALEDGEEGWR